MPKGDYFRYRNLCADLSACGGQAGRTSKKCAGKGKTLGDCYDEHPLINFSLFVTRFCIKLVCCKISCLCETTKLNLQLTGKLCAEDLQWRMIG